MLFVAVCIKTKVVYVKYYKGYFTDYNITWLYRTIDILLYDENHWLNNLFPLFH